MNFSDLQTYTLGLLDDPQGTYFTPTVLNPWLNQGAKEVQKDLLLSGNNFYLKCVTTALNANQQDYVLPDDFYYLNRLDLVLTGTPPNQIFTALSPITVNQIDLVINTAGQPAYYFLKSNKLVLWPTPNTGGQLLRLFYSYELAEMVNQTDIPNIPEVYHQMIGIMAAMQGFLKDGRDPTPILGERERYQKMMKDASNERLLDAPRSVVVTDSNYGAPIYF